jgi:hypothetical protein
MKKARFLIAILLILTFTLTACGSTDKSTAKPKKLGKAPVVPASVAYLEGEQIYYILTEISDAGLAETLSEKLESPVVHVPVLSIAPYEVTSGVYVFKNGVEGDGPLGFQVDVLDGPPGTAGYTPFRRLYFVSWNVGSTAREIYSLGDLTAAEKAGELTITESTIIANMPILTWPGGTR